MSYLALYRKYRPTKLSEVVKQEHIVQTLINQIKNDRIGHAYLFCGPRGTGKTSVAKIFARAVNCLNDKSGEPCGKCEACKSLSEQSSIDIMEIDAASNNRVDEIRDLRDKVQFPPVTAKYKVYIVDEVHMLTDQAFNALLKTLEEPPAHAIFILATTEVQKIPATILSRCMRFDFKLIPIEDIAAHLKNILKEIGKEFEDEAVFEIARSGGGSMRDALSVADICLSYSEGKLTYKDVLEVLGGADLESLHALAADILSGSTGGALTLLNSLIENGKSTGVLCRDLISYFRGLVIAKTCTDASAILNMPSEYFEKLKAVSAGGDINRILRCLEIFTNADGSLRYASSPKIVLETAVIRAALPEKDSSVDALFSRVAALEKGAPAVQKPIEQKPVQEQAKEQPKPIEQKPAQEPIKQPQQTAKEPLPHAAIPPHAEDGDKLFGLVLSELRKRKEFTLYTVCRELACTLDSGKLLIRTSSISEYNLLKSPSSGVILAEVISGMGISGFDVVMTDTQDKKADGDEDIIRENFPDADIITK